MSANSGTTDAGYPACQFQEGDLVMFANRAQSTGFGMKVQEVDISMFDIRVKVDDRWWVPESFITYAQWKAQNHPDRAY